MVKIIDWPKLDPTILQLTSEGKSPNYIAKQIGLQRETVVKRMESALNLETKRNGPRKSANWAGSEDIKCSICSKVKHMSEYLKIKKDSVYYYSFCKACKGDKERVRYLASPVTWRKKAYDIKVSAKRRGIAFDLSEDYLQYIHTTQNGLCAYTNVLLDLSTGRGLADDCVSVDRFDTSLGYVTGNVIICSTRSNTIKYNQSLEEFEKWIPLWYESGLAVLSKLNAGWPPSNDSVGVVDIS